MDTKSAVLFDSLTTVIRNAVRDKDDRSIDGIEMVANIEGLLERVVSKKNVWEELKEIDAPSFAIPLKDGGLELGIEVDLMLLEEMGKALYSKPYIETLTAIEILSQINNSELIQEDIDLLKSGSRFLDVIMIDKNMNFLELEKNYISIDSFSCYISNLKEVEYFLIIVDNFIYKVPKNNRSINITTCADITETNISQVNLNMLKLNRHDSLNTNPVLFSHVLPNQRIRQAAFLKGLARGAIEEAIKYTNKRKQFDKKLIEHQAVSFKLASLLAELEGASAKIEYSTNSEGSKEFLLDATESLAYMAEIALKVSRETLHLHGAYGLTKLSKIEEFYRRIALEAIRYGTPNDLWLEASNLKLNEKESNKY
ncbi:hypothetical protein FZC78_22555 [Rossellomorea vietnamensis]|uniref:Acyl-CoA dehydrogenase/oxidase C-terminal domain-containing protein n=1 Tax=Rossellomorea vietnamensis TaxID=218284 RepID=A0A5D4NGI2_9BACI|nr:acyl-CoA dehydrogenase family protein [Rossellomorea vietnamensis]TYS13040.1 hypothetical protein FZC78_22555 [Rossellomorea vietnamensis]